jgi:hypothetical protein
LRFNSGGLERFGERLKARLQDVSHWEICKKAKVLFYGSGEIQPKCTKNAHVY